MRLSARLLSFVALLPLPLAAEDSLLQVYDRAVAYDATFRAAAFARDAAVEAYPQARAAILPQLDLGYGYAYSDSETQLSGQPAQRRTGTSRSLDLTLNQALFNWSAFKQLDQASQQVAQAQYGIAGEDLILRVAQTYFGVLSAQDAVRSARAENEAVGRQLEQAKERFDVGLSAITDVQEAQARFDLTVAELINAERQLDAAREALAEVAGVEGRALAVLQDEIPLPAPNPADVQQWVDTALQRNLSLMSAQHAAGAAEAGVKVAKGARLPTVNAQGVYSDGRSETGVFPAETTDQRVGVQLNLPIFSGLATQSRISQAAGVLEQRKAELEGSERLVQRQTRDAYQGVIAGAARVRALNQAVISSRTALEASETGLEVGTRTAIDVLNAQQQLFFAERNALQARYDYLLAVLSLKRAAGSLSRADLEDIERVLVRR
jgi:outer membrane protein